MKKSELKAIIKEQLLLESDADRITSNIEDAITDSWTEQMEDYGVDFEDDGSGSKVNEAFYKITQNYIRQITIELRKHKNIF